MGILSPDDAWARLRPLLHSLPVERVERRQALGRILARPLAARSDVPGDDVSAMDGYAVGEEVAAGESRAVTGTIAAGDRPGHELAAGTVVRIMTGAPVPRGADRIVPVEETDGGRERAVFHSSATPGAHVRRRGEILREGDPLIAAGAALSPGALSLLAAHGYSGVDVYRLPRVAVMATGDELVAPDVDPAPGQLRDSNSDFLLAACTALGLAPVSLGIAPDRADELADRVRAGLAYDVLLLCGGVSMGEFDLVEGVLAGLGCEAVFDAVAIQPGKPLVAARHPGGLVFGLPGNPASVMVGFSLFVAPALRSLAGAGAGFWQGALAGRLSAPLPGAGARDRFLPAALALASGELQVRPIATRGSHDLAAYSQGDALVRVRAGAAPAAAGERCEVLPLAGAPHDVP